MKNTIVCACVIALFSSGGLAELGFYWLALSSAVLSFALAVNI